MREIRTYGSEGGVAFGSFLPLCSVSLRSPRLRRPQWGVQSRLIQFTEHNLHHRLHELPPYIKAYLKQHPTVNVHVEYRRSNQVYEDVVGNLVDLGLVAYPSKDSRLEAESICNDRLVLVCHPDRVKDGKRSVFLREIHGERFIGFEPDIPTRKGIDRILKDHEVEVSVVMEFDNIETVKRAVEINAGVSIVPQSTVAQEVAMKSLVQLEISDGTFYRPLAVIYRKNKVLSPAMKQFVEILKTV